MRQRFRWSDERTLALDDLRKNGRASTRQLAARWDWSQAKVQRFLTFIDSHKPILNRLTDSVKPESVNTKPIHHESVKTDALDKTLLDKKPLERTGGGYTSDLIDEMNRCLSARFGDSYKPVRHDNFSSVRVGQALQSAGVDRGWALLTLTRHAMQFHPEKHGKGALPKSLAFFAPRLLKAWKSEPQTEIPLLTVETPHPLSGIQGYTPAGANKPQKPARIRELAFGVMEEYGNAVRAR